MRHVNHTVTNPDSLGIALQARAREAGDAYIREQEAKNPFYRTSDAGMSQSSANAGMNYSGWGAFFQALKEAAGGRSWKLAGGPSPEGSTQLRGSQGLVFGHGVRAMEESAPSQSAWMREQGRNDRRRQLASLDALRAAGNLPSRT